MILLESDSLYEEILMSENPEHFLFYAIVEDFEGITGFLDESRIN